MHSFLCRYHETQLTLTCQVLHHSKSVDVRYVQDGRALMHEHYCIIIAFYSYRSFNPSLRSPKTPHYANVYSTRGHQKHTCLVLSCLIFVSDSLLYSPVIYTPDSRQSPHLLKSQPTIQTCLPPHETQPRTRSPKTCPAQQPT
jgi:hypothetical protein